MRLSKLTIMPKFKKALPSGIGPDRGMSAPPSTRTNMRLDGNKFQRCQSALSHYRKRPPAGGSKAQMDCEPFMPDALRDRTAWLLLTLRWTLPVKRASAAARRRWNSS